MTRQLCLGQADKGSTRPRAKSARKAGEEPKRHTFTIIERVPVRLSAHNVVWAALRKRATRSLIIDSEHPEEAFPAGVILIDQLGDEAVASIANVLAERRSLALGAEKHGADSDVLAKRLDRIFDQELEWLSIRNLLAGALRRPTGRGVRRKKARALLLIDI